MHLCSEPLNTLCLCLSFLVRSRILGKILRVSKMQVPDGIFSLTSCTDSWGVYELPCRVGEVSGPFENTKKLLPAHSPSISLVLRIF